jgi:hypothetical protein
MFVYSIGSSVKWIHEQCWVCQVPANIPMDMAGIATAVRNALKRCREPDHIYDWVTLASHLRLEAVNTSKSTCFPVDDNQLIVGSTTV